MRLMLIFASVRSLVALVRGALVLAGLGVMAIAVDPVARAQTGAAPVIGVTYFDVAANAVGQGAAFVKGYRDAARREGANLEFTVLQETSRPNRFVIVEGWKDQAAFDTRQKSAATTQFLDALKPIRNSPPNVHVLQDFATGPVRAQPATGAGTLITVDHVDFQPQFGDAGGQLLKTFAEAARKGEGVLRFDVYQEPQPHANHYSVVGVWANAQAFDRHETAAPTLHFRAASARPGRANLYDVRLYKAL